MAPIILANASYYGTLAAVRSLGRAGVEVLTVDPSMFCRGRYSRYTSQHLACPAFEKTNALAEWLLQLGRTGPRRAIYATSDAVSFALALYRDDLSGAFDLYQPGLDTIMSILDKGQLLQNAQAIGMDTPATWFPQTGDEAAKIAKDVGGKLLIKPRSQLAQRTAIFIFAQSSNSLRHFRCSYPRSSEVSIHTSLRSMLASGLFETEKADGSGQN